ncbi:MAG: hemolysin family protein [bacterium]|jgi:putative hemolysin|nr:hemolysin family protein [bacterium]
MLYVDLFIILALTLMNGLLAMSEMAVVSSRRSRLDQWANQGNRGARRALRLVDDPGRFLSTVQIGITLVGIFAGAFSGVTLGTRLGTWLDTFPLFAPYGTSFGIALTVVLITYLSLIIGELIPKRIALSQPERIACLIAPPMRGLSALAAPVVWVLHISTETVFRLFRFSDRKESTVTEDEVKSLIAEGTQEGVFVLQEKEMIEGVLRLADRPVRVIMTPRPQIIWLDIQADKQTIGQICDTHRFSRLLVCDQSIDNPVGFIHTKDLLPIALCDHGLDLHACLKPLLFVPEFTPILTLLNQFKENKVHLATVVDEYGMTKGLITPTDVLEAIAGDLPEQGENSEPWIIQREDGSWLVDGMTPTDEVEAETGIPIGSSVKTLASFMLFHLGRIPEAGAFFEDENARFEIVDMDRNRIDKVLISPKAERREVPSTPSNDS